MTQLRHMMKSRLDSTTGVLQLQIVVEVSLGIAHDGLSRRGIKRDRGFI